ncbi:MAG: RidA family protein [Thermoplasmata archaeon]
MAPSLEDWESQLPPVPAPVANYALFRRSGRIAFTSGVVPLVEGRLQAEGRLGEDLTVEEGYEAARTCALLALSILREHLKGLDRIKQVLRAVVFVACAPGFHDQPRVADGASDLLVEVLGEAGTPTRIAVGVAELPLGAPVELALTVETRR